MPSARNPSVKRLGSREYRLVAYAADPKAVPPKCSQLQSALGLRRLTVKKEIITQLSSAPDGIPPTASAAPPRSACEPGPTSCARGRRTTGFLATGAAARSPGPESAKLTLKVDDLRSLFSAAQRA